MLLKFFNIFVIVCVLFTLGCDPASSDKSNQAAKPTPKTPEKQASQTNTVTLEIAGMT